MRAAFAGAVSAGAMWIVILCAAPLLANAQSESTTALDRYLSGLESWRAEFSQTVSDSRGRMRPPQRGRLLVQRPGKFRYEVGPPEQVMVADGRNVWFLDRDLDQVTVRPAGSAEAATPAMLLSGTVPLRSRFVVTPAGRREGLEWVRVAPKRADSEFKEMRFGFSGAELKRLEIDDKMGQRARWLLDVSVRNARIDAAEFRFTPPSGTDVIGTPVE